MQSRSYDSDFQDQLIKRVSDYSSIIFQFDRQAIQTLITAQMSNINLRLDPQFESKADSIQLQSIVIELNEIYFEKILNSDLLHMKDLLKVLNLSTKAIPLFDGNDHSSYLKDLQTDTLPAYFQRILYKLALFCVLHLKCKKD